MSDAPDLVLVMTDQHRHDWIGPTSRGFFETPFLDRLAAGGVLFENAYSSSTTCVPSRTSILTGLHHHRVPTAGSSIAMADGVWTIARALRAAGYDTALFGRMHFTPIDAEHGFDTRRICENINPGSGYVDSDLDDYSGWMAARGLPDWRVWDPGPRGGTVRHLAGTPRTYPADADHHPTGWIADEAVRYLRSRSKDRPLFLVVSFPHPHAPYDPPEPYASMYDPADVEIPADGFEVNDEVRAAFGRSWGAYDGFAAPKVRATDRAGDELHRRIITSIRGLVRHIDDAVERVVGELDLDRATVVFTSDHGDYGGHRGLYSKVPWIPFEDILRVPLVVAGSAVSAPGTAVANAVQTGSFAATCLELAGLAPPDADGDFASLAPYLAGAPSPEADRPLVAALSSGYPAVRIGDVKVIGSFEPGQLLAFDLRDDPGETHSVAADPRYADVLERAGEVFRAALETPVPGRFEAWPAAVA